MNCNIFVEESNDLSISDVRKQICFDVCQKLVDHSDVEVVDRIPDHPQDNNEDDTSDDYDQEELSDADNFEEDSYKYMGSDNDSVGSGNQDDLMVMTNTDTICLNDNLLDSGGRFSKNCTKKSNYDNFPSLPTEFIPINWPFSAKDIISRFEMNNGVEVADDNIPVDLLKILGKKNTSFRQMMFLSPSWFPSTRSTRRNSRNVRITPSCLYKATKKNLLFIQGS